MAKALPPRSGARCEECGAPLDVARAFAVDACYLPATLALSEWGSSRRRLVCSLACAGASRDRAKRLGIPRVTITPPPEAAPQRRIRKHPAHL